MVVTARQEQAAAPVETPEPTPEGTTRSLNTYGHTHSFQCLQRCCCMVIDLPFNIELVDFSVNLTLGLLFDMCCKHISAGHENFTDILLNYVY